MSKLRHTVAGATLALLVCAGAQAAAISTTLTVNSTPTIGATGVAVAGTASFTNGVGAGTFSATLAASASGYSGPYTITLSGGGGTITGVFTMPVAMLTSSGTASATVTGGSGTYSGATGSFPSLPGAGAIGSTGSFTLNFSGAGTLTTGGTVGPTPPAITAVQDAASNTPNIAQGSIFIVKGTNLSPSGYTPFAPPRPTISGGVKVTFTPVSGGLGTDAYLVYLYNQSGVNQLACILPSTVSPGNYNVTVTNGSVSSPVATKVVATKVGLFTQDQSGTGLAVVFDYISQSENDVNRLTTGNYNGSLSSPAKPGQTLVAWGTGIGPYAAGDNTAGISYDFSKSEPIAAIVGGVSIPVAFAGLNNYAGEDQINFTLPANVPTGCAVTLQISVNGVLSAATSIAIAPTAGTTACVQTGYTTQQLQTLDQGGTITAGGFALAQTTVADPSIGTYKADAIAGAFSQITGYQLSSTGNTQATILANSGGCVVSRVTSTGSTVTAGHSTGLDAGTVTLTGPSGTSLNKQQLTETSNTYSYSFTEGISNPFLASGAILPGTYTLTGAGGNDVGPFNTSITIGPLFTLSNPLPATVTESAGLTIKWTGGNASDTVVILGASDTTTGTGANQTSTVTAFVCTTTAGQGTFTVPASILTWLPTITAAQVAAGNANGSLSVSSSATPSTSFNATLKKDGSNIPSFFSYTFVTGGSVLYQ